MYIRHATVLLKLVPELPDVSMLLKMPTFDIAALARRWLQGKMELENAW